MAKPPPFDPVAWSKGQPIRWLTPLIYIGCGLAFYTDVTNDVSLAFGLFYVPLVCTAIFYRNRSSVWWLAGFATLMTALGFFLPAVNIHVAQAVTNRILSLAAIWITACLVRHTRIIQERLAAETHRAEAAERIKTVIFTNLSDEIRNPLHAIIGMSSLMMADCRPDQKAPLSQLNSGGRRLLGTIDNLIDLTQLEDRSFAVEPVDVASVVRAVADGAQSSANERQIALSVEVEAVEPLMTRGDPWAVRRIVENLLSNAIKFSPPGGVVLVAVEASGGTVSTTVQDAGIGMSRDVVRHLGEPFYQAEVNAGTGTGLALCRRLAQAMGGELAFDSELGIGTTATLRMPAGALA